MSVKDSLEPDHNPFVPMAPAARAAVVGFVLLYSVVVPTVREILWGPGTPLSEARLLADIVFQLLLLVPLVAYRASYGWLHPIVFPVLFQLAVTFTREPLLLVSPLSMLAPMAPELAVPGALRGWSDPAVARAHLFTSLLQSLALLVYYAGFFAGPDLRFPRLAFPRPRRVPLVGVAVVAFALVLCAVFIQLRGGLLAHIASLALGRFRTLSSLGPITVLADLGMLAVLAWLGLDRNALRSPVFWLAVPAALSVPFLMKGARSDVIYPGVMLFMVWILHRRRIPAVPIALFGAAALFAFGFLGAVRKSGRMTDGAATVVRELDVAATARVAVEDAARRTANGGMIGVMAKVPAEVGFQWGRTYVATATFFVPRAVWPEKPRGVGALNAWLIHGRDPEGGGIPLGAVGEAYWNFSIMGVVVLFFGFGAFHRWLAAAFRRTAAAPAAVPLYVLTLFTLDFYSRSILVWVQQTVLLLIILYAMRAIRFHPLAGTTHAAA